MAEAPDGIATEESRPAADVDELLDRVEALTHEITTDTEAPASDSAAPAITGDSAASQTDPAVAAPDAAPESAGSVGEELNDLLHDPDAPVEGPAGPAGPAPSPVCAADAAPPRGGESPSEDGSPGGMAPVGGTRRVEGERDDDKRGIGGRHEVDAEVDVEGDAGVDAEAEPDGEAEAPPPPIHRRLLSRAGAALRFSLRAIRAVPILGINALLKTILAIDLPFASLPAGTKRIIGFVALATLLSGMLSWVLPDLLNTNPFADMDRYMQTDG